jgi:hypothetical protein
MNQERFDDVAKGLASGTVSRGEALRWMGGALVGAALASVPRVAWAANDGNSACAHFCTQIFPPGPQRGECISAAARGEGLCFECGPEAPDQTRVLCGQVCCASGETCSATEQCVVPSNICTEANSSPGGGTDCGNSPSGTILAGQPCFCRPLVEGGGACTTNQVGSCSKGCNSNADCPRGTVCGESLLVPGFPGVCESTCETGNAAAACVCPDGRFTCNNVCCLAEQSCVSVGGIPTCQPAV